MWITEIGWSTAHLSGQDGQGHDRYVTEPKQASFVGNSILRSLATPASGARPFPYVDRTYIYTWSRDLPADQADDREGFFGVRKNNGDIKPAFVRVCELARTNCPL